MWPEPTGTGSTSLRRGSFSRTGRRDLLACSCCSCSGAGGLSARAGAHRSGRRAGEWTLSGGAVRREARMARAAGDLWLSLPSRWRRAGRDPLGFLTTVWPFPAAASSTLLGLPRSSRRGRRARVHVFSRGDRIPARLVQRLPHHRVACAEGASAVLLGLRHVYSSLPLHPCLALRLDPSLAEAAVARGDAVGTFRRVTLPLLRPRSSGPASWSS